ncbi:hypothetical protein P3T16_004819 [Paraburkholderia sp. GAS42]
MPSGLLYAKYRQPFEAKCVREGVELIRIDPAYTATIGAVKYTSRRAWSVHPAAAGVVAHRGQKLTERLPRPDTAVRVPVRGGHHALELLARKSRESRATACRSAHTAHRRMVRERWLATRDGSPRGSMKDSFGCSGLAAPFGRAPVCPAQDNLYMQIWSGRVDWHAVQPALFRRSGNVRLQAVD